MKIYEILGLTEDDVVEMQTWLFSMMGKTDSIANMISCASDYFKDDMKIFMSCDIAIRTLNAVAGKTTE